jgi:hypothetical protein
MKTKNILGLVAIVAVAVAMAFNVSVSNKKTDTASLLALKNVEALASGEVSVDFYCIVVDGFCDYYDGVEYEGIRVNNPN